MPETPKKPRSGPHPAALLGLLLVRGLWISVLVMVPTLGVWIASSLAAFHNGPVWLVSLSGLLLFPILPFAWEGFSRWRASRRDPGKDRTPRKPLLTTFDRLVLRTLTINVCFVTALLAARPAETFAALSARGDWPIESLDHSLADRARSVLFTVADQLEWLYLWANPNDFTALLEDQEHEAKPDDPERVPDRKPDRKPDGTTGRDTQNAEGDPPSETDDPSATEPSSPRFEGPWPMPDEVHPLLLEMPDEAKVDIASVGRWVAEHEKDPFARVKALHDFAAMHVAYDAPNYVAGRYPPQDAAHVFETGVGVCAGYANLMVALGDASGDDIVWISGYSRRPGGAIDGEGHAWNAARIEGAWYLFDATWNAGWVEGDEFTRHYRTDYLFTPPDVFALSHIPDDPDWQLRTVALTRGEFLRMPTLEPRFYANGWTLVTPNRAQVSGDRFDLVVTNEDARYLLVDLAPLEGGESVRCEVTGGGTSTVRALCEPAEAGRYTVKLFDAAQEYGSYAWLGSFQLNR